jgi:hypothetical protein
VLLFLKVAPYEFVDADEAIVEIVKVILHAVVDAALQKPLGDFVNGMESPANEYQIVLLTCLHHALYICHEAETDELVYEIAVTVDDIDQSKLVANVAFTDDIVQSHTTVIDCSPCRRVVFICYCMLDRQQGELERFEYNMVRGIAQTTRMVFVDLFKEHVYVIEGAGIVMQLEGKMILDKGLPHVALVYYAIFDAQGSAMTSHESIQVVLWQNKTEESIGYHLLNTYHLDHGNNQVYLLDNVWIRMQPSIDGQITTLRRHHTQCFDFLHDLTLYDFIHFSYFLKK